MVVGSWILAGGNGSTCPFTGAETGLSTICILRKRLANAVGCPGTNMMSLSLRSTVSGCCDAQNNLKYLSPVADCSFPMTPGDSGKTALTCVTSKVHLIGWSCKPVLQLMRPCLRHTAAVSVSHLAVWEPWLLMIASCSRTLAPVACTSSATQ